MESRREMAISFRLQAMAVASNLSIGKEGPSVHMACCVGNVISRSFQKYRTSKGESKNTDLRL